MRAAAENSLRLSAAPHATCIYIHIAEGCPSSCELALGSYDPIRTEWLIALMNASMPTSYLRPHRQAATVNILASRFRAAAAGTVAYPFRFSGSPGACGSAICDLYSQKDAPPGQWEFAICVTLSFESCDKFMSGICLSSHNSNYVSGNFPKGII